MKSNMIRNDSIIRNSCEIPQFSLWWYDFPDPIGRHIGIVVSNTNFNMHSPNVLTAILTTQIDKEGPFSIKAIVRGKISLIQLCNVHCVKKSNICLSDYVGMIIDPSIVSTLTKTLPNIFDPYYSFGPELYRQDSTTRVTFNKTSTPDVNIHKDLVTSESQICPKNEICDLDIEELTLRLDCVSDYIVRSELNPLKLSINNFNHYIQDVAVETLISIRAIFNMFSNDDLSEILDISTDDVDTARQLVIEKISDVKFSDDIKEKLSKLINI